MENGEKICPIMAAGEFAGGASVLHINANCVAERCALWNWEKRQCGLKN